ncbi:sensor histidine kinase [Rhodoferax sediminis]|uniref:Sensor histidine kinase n=1 Tax=Rhodoferax sediminis TaxID=2509614 RepID=A0A515DD50_9BURK|nr:histidine kinase [Rhodoferax sediminis]QDL38351.1 sensor histidine kinase [Rhodoferax sediminis]
MQLASPGTLAARRIDGIALLRHYLQTLAFCLAISALQYFASPDKPYEVPLVYSLCIGSVTWALIDLGRHLFNPNPETGWPHGWGGIALATLGVLGGYFIGTYAADAWFGWSSWQQSVAQQRVSWLITLAAGVVISYYFYTQGKSRHLQGRMQQVQRQATEARLKLLETQLEPHMLFNTLANLRVLIGSDPARAQAMLDHLIDYLRATLGASRASEHALQTEFERLRDYLALMAVRMGARLQYTLDLPPELASHPVPTLLLQPLVENSIRHGLEPKVEGGSVRVSARREGDWLMLEVTDTGVGIQPGMEGLPAAPTTAGGFGVAQVRERLATAYGNQCTIELIAPNEGGTRATLRFPYKNPATTPVRTDALQNSSP